MTDAAAPRLRFSPSPTGFLHVGGARSALYNWLVARHTGGTFILRIEDTDAERNREEWVDGIYDSLRWLGLDWDEQYRQSERTELYADAAGKLFADGLAYYCDCTRDDVVARTGDQNKGYDRFCRDRGLTQGPGRALRFRVPDDGAVVVHDLVRGEPTFEHSSIEDFPLVRGNGGALFILANVVDDVDNRVTHVVRGEEHLPNTPKYLLLWRALGGGGLPEPVFAHLPVLVNEKRRKLSKRRPEDKVELELYRDEGYLPEAMVNYLALLGWGPGGDREFLSMEELTAEFRLEDVNSSPAFFDQKKLLHFNQHYIAALSPSAFVEQSAPFLDKAGLAWERSVFEAIAPLVQERAHTLADVPGMVDFFFVEPPVLDERDWEKHMAKRADVAGPILEDALSDYGSCAWDAAALHEATGAIAERRGLGLAKAQAPIRVAVTGKAVGPPLFESLALLGRERVLSRLVAARARLAP
ncbi:MAG: glutamyl-tRNA synthetase [Acidimicrobiaceae bacterium]|nr:glutamyl-tRNA synthetase [Acidimicrobiaceae bacterium]